MKLISICPSNTELIHYLGLTQFLIGVDDFSDWPKSIDHLPRLGPDLSIDMEQVEKLKPDLVIASLSVPGMEKNIEELVKRNIPHIILNPQSLEEIGQDLLILGKAVGYEEHATKTHNAYEAALKQFRLASKKTLQTPTLYWEWWPKPVFTPGSINWLTEVSELAGGENIFKDIELASVQTDWQDVYNRNPEHICLAWVGVRKEKVNPIILNKRPNWLELEAMKNDRVHILEESLFCRPSPRLLEGILTLGRILHPEVYKEIELPELFQT